MIGKIEHHNLHNTTHILEDVAACKHQSKATEYSEKIITLLPQLLDEFQRQISPSIFVTIAQ